MIAIGDDEPGVAVVRDVSAVRDAMARVLARVRDRAAPARPASVAAAYARAASACPVMLDVRARRAFVAGGGREPASKAEALASLGATVVIWAPVHDETGALIGQPGIEAHSG